MAIEAVVFDLGRVLIHWDPEGFYDRQIGPQARQALFSQVPLYEVNAQIDLGAEFQSSIYNLAARYPAHGAAIRMWHDHWIDMAAPAIEPSAVLLRALKAAGLPVYALTNFGIGPLRVAERAYPVLREFDQRFVSGELHIAKPDPRIYEALEQGTGHAPERLLFTDDLPANIAAARARGWQTHLFEGPEGFAARLVAEGLLARSPL